MKTTSPERPLLFAALLFFIATFQLVGLIRYVRRLPEDLLGICLYAATIVLAGIAAAVVIGGSTKS